MLWLHISDYFKALVSFWNYMLSLGTKQSSNICILLLNLQTVAHKIPLFVGGEDQSYTVLFFTHQIWLGLGRIF